MIIQNSFVRISLVTVALLLIPLVLKFPWTRSDFVIAGALIAITGLIYEFGVKRAGKYKLAAAIVLILVFLYIWAELAVGIFTNWGS